MQSKLQASVRMATGLTKHTLGVLGPNVPESNCEMPIAVQVVIEADDDGAYLIRFDINDKFCGDTWHESIEKAKQQAQSEFNISTTDWKTMPLP